MADVDKRTVTINLFWRFLERCGAQGVTFIVSVVLARLLDLEVHGTIGLVLVITSILQVFVDSGMGSALIQKKDADDLDFSSVFFFNLVLCLFLYLCIFGAAPFIARFYRDPSLTALIRVLSLTVVISGVKNVQQAYVSRNLMFKRFFFATLGGTVGAAVLGIWMAYNNFGVWALVAQNLFNQVAGTIILWMTVKWRPQKRFSLVRLKMLFSYGWKILLSSFLEKLNADIRALIIGKAYSPEDLAYYNKAQQFPNLITSNINSSIDSVLLPSMSTAQEQVERVKAMTRRAISVSTYLMMPLMVGLMVCAEPLVRLVLTEKWMGCVPFLRIFCVIYAFQPIHTANLSAIKSLGRSDFFLKLRIVTCSLELITISITMWYGSLAIAWGALVVNFICQIVNSWPNRKLIKYTYLEQVKDILPQVMAACVMGVIVYGVVALKLNDIVTLFIQVIFGGIIYLGISVAFRFESYSYVIDVLKKVILRRK